MEQMSFEEMQMLGIQSIGDPNFNPEDTTQFSRKLSELPVPLVQREVINIAIEMLSNLRTLCKARIIMGNIAPDNLIYGKDKKIYFIDDDSAFYFDANSKKGETKQISGKQPPI